MKAFLIRLLRSIKLFSEVCSLRFPRRLVRHTFPAVLVIVPCGPARFYKCGGCALE